MFKTEAHPLNVRGEYPGVASCCPQSDVNSDGSSVTRIPIDITQSPKEKP